MLNGVKGDFGTWETTTLILSKPETLKPIDRPKATKFRTID